MAAQLPPKLDRLPARLPLEGAVRLELEEGVPVFHATVAVQERIEALLAKHQESGLTAAEASELDAYEELDDHLSFVNRAVRNSLQRSPARAGAEAIGNLVRWVGCCWCE